LAVDDCGPESDTALRAAWLGGSPRLNSLGSTGLCAGGLLMASAHYRVFNVAKLADVSQPQTFNRQRRFAYTSRKRGRLAIVRFAAERIVICRECIPLISAINVRRASAYSR
jgi:hypothetical protein